MEYKAKVSTSLSHGKAQQQITVAVKLEGVVEEGSTVVVIVDDYKGAVGSSVIQVGEREG